MDLKTYFLQNLNFRYPNRAIEGHSKPVVGFVGSAAASFFTWRMESEWSFRSDYGAQESH